MKVVGPVPERRDRDNLMPGNNRHSHCKPGLEHPIDSVLFFLSALADVVTAIVVWGRLVVSAALVYVFQSGPRVGPQVEQQQGRCAVGHELGDSEPAPADHIERIIEQ